MGNTSVRRGDRSDDAEPTLTACNGDLPLMGAIDTPLPTNQPEGGEEAEVMVMAAMLKPVVGLPGGGGAGHDVKPVVDGTGL